MLCSSSRLCYLFASWYMAVSFSKVLFRFKEINKHPFTSMIKSTSERILFLNEGKQGFRLVPFTWCIYWILLIILTNAPCYFLFMILCFVLSAGFSTLGLWPCVWPLNEQCSRDWCVIVSLITFEIVICHDDQKSPPLPATKPPRSQGCYICCLQTVPFVFRSRYIWWL